MNDGIYLEFFAVKEGKRINFKIVSLRQLANILTNGLIDSIEEIVETEMLKEKEG